MMNNFFFIQCRIIFRPAQLQLPTIPFSYLMNNTLFNWIYPSDDCATFPCIYDLKINNHVWQHLQHQHVSKAVLYKNLINIYTNLTTYASVTGLFLSIFVIFWGEGRD